MRTHWTPVVARKHYNGVTIGYIVGWKHIHCNMVRNIREGLIFKNVTLAQNFRRRMENQRVHPYVEFEIIED